jgi:hypothetical protein
MVYIQNFIKEKRKIILAEVKEKKKKEKMLSKERTKV